MSRIETIGNATLYLGDCRDILPAIPKIDLIATDPPYGIVLKDSKKSSGGHGGRREITVEPWERVKPPRATFDLILSRATYVAIWGGNYFTDCLPPSTRWLVWDKGQRIKQSDGELAWVNVGNALRIFTLNRAAISTDGVEHTTQKPVKLMEWTIGHFPETCGHIADPFMGSGSTGVAAIRMGRKFIGVEIEERYFDVACRRVEAASSQFKLAV